MKPNQHTILNLIDAFIDKYPQSPITQDWREINPSSPLNVYLESIQDHPLSSDSDEGMDIQAILEVALA